MTRFFPIALCLAAFFPLASIQAGAEDQPASSSKPVTYVYVTRPTHIDGFSVASNGKLTAVPGSPFANIAVANLVGNGKYLFAADQNAIDIDAFSIAANGSIKLSVKNAINTDLGAACQYAFPLILDHTGATLYAAASVGGLCDSTDYESFEVQSGGKLKYLGDSGQTFLYDTPLSLSSSNKYAYGADCVDYEGGYIDTFAAYARSSSGHLTLDSDASLPDIKPANSSDFYCHAAVAADSSNHLAASVQAINSDLEEPSGSPQLATYSISSKGNLSTSSTYKNMPVADTGASILSMSPSGKLLAVGGQGFQIFHFNGGSPISKYSAVLQPSIAFQAFGWDNDNHLFAIGSGKLFVYTVTTTSIEEASGSPYSIPEAGTVLVQAVTP